MKQVIELDLLAIEIIDKLNRINAIFNKYSEKDETAFERFALVSQKISVLAIYEMIGKSFFNLLQPNEHRHIEPVEFMIVQEEVKGDAIQIGASMAKAFESNSTIFAQQATGNRYDTATYIGELDTKDPNIGRIPIFLLLDARGKTLNDLKSNPGWVQISNVLLHELPAVTYTII